MGKIKFISMTITNFHNGEDLFVTVQYEEQGEVTNYSKLRATSFLVSKKATIEEIGKMVVARVRGFDKSEEKRALYEKIKVAFGNNYQEIEKAIREASSATIGWETESIFQVPDFKFDRFKDYFEKVIFKRTGGSNAN